MDRAQLSRALAELERESYLFMRDVFGMPPSMIDRVVRDLQQDLPPPPSSQQAPKSDLPTRDDFLIFRLTPATDVKGDEECPICIKPLEKPVRTPCGHVFCAFCLTKWLQEHTSCPIDRKELYASNSSASSETDETIEDDEDVLAQRFEDLDMEPFNDLTDFAFHIHNEEIIEHAARFDIYNHLHEYNDYDTYSRLPADIKVRVDIDALRPAVLGAVYRLASDTFSRFAHPISRNDVHAGAWRAMIHGLCRREWLEVVHCIDRFLQSINGRLMSRKEFEGQFKSRLAGYPRWKGRKDWSWATERFAEDRELAGFAGKLAELRKWVVWEAASRTLEERCECGNHSSEEDGMPELV